MNGNNLEIPVGGGEQELQIRSDRAWKIVSPTDLSWLIINTPEGKGDAIVKLSATSSQDPYDRVANLQLESTEGTASKQSITVTQKSHVAWNKIIKSNAEEHPESIIKAIDGGFVVLTTVGSGRTYIHKLSEDGSTIQWTKAIGGGTGKRIIAAYGGYTIIGIAASGGYNAMQMTRLTADGQKVEWQYELYNWRQNYDITSFQLTSKGYVVAGSTNYDYGSSNMYIAGLSDDGLGILWEKEIDKANAGERIISLVETPGGFLITGSIQPGNYPITYIAKIATADRKIIWEKTIDNGESNVPVSIIPNDGGYIVMGNKNAGMFIAKVSEESVPLIWEMNLIGKNCNSGTPLIASDGGYIFVSESAEGSIRNFHLSKLKTDGQTIAWEKTVKNLFAPTTIFETTGGYITGGSGSDEGKEAPRIALIRK
ncbi:MAG: BACON domain-containing protein [Flavisolibacter sp.]|nr:BACON domain-containing protein [Flavisolibacter sp.]